MLQRKYAVEFQFPLGKREGTLFIEESNSALKGQLDILGKKRELWGSISENGQITLHGRIASLISEIPFSATGYISGEFISLSINSEAGNFQATGKETDL